MLSLLCPPCPSRIVSKLAFLPPESTYSIIEQPIINHSEPVSRRETTTQIESNPTTTVNNSNINSERRQHKYKLQLDERAEWQFTDTELNHLEVFYADYGRNERLACMYVKVCDKPKYTILFSHANAADLGLMSSFYLSLSTKLGCNAFGYDYSGYGSSSGKPTEKSLYANIEVAWRELSNRYNVQPDEVILYGQSIGTVPTVDLATKHQFAGVILHSPLTSGLRLAFPNTKRTWFFDAFPNIDKVSKISSPVLVIHGTEDQTVDITHGQMIYSLCPNPVAPLWVEGADHNDVELFREYLERLKKFINRDIARPGN